MQKAILILFLSLSVNFSLQAQNTALDGTTIHYEYSSGSRVEAKFANNLYHFHWTAGPYKGIKGYTSYELMELSKKRYVINFMVESHQSYVTLLFDFKKDKMVGSAIINDNGTITQSIEEAKIKYKSLQ